MPPRILDVSRAFVENIIFGNLAAPQEAGGARLLRRL
jgi:hypothetical protein